MFGFSPCIMAESRKPPFSLAGTFASGDDGWALTGMLAVNTQPRTAPGNLYVNVASGQAIYTIPASVCSGLTISASIWHKCNSGQNTSRGLYYRIGPTGSWLVLDSVADANTAYAKFAGSFQNPGNDDVYIRVFGGQLIYFDDWEISGV